MKVLIVGLDGLDYNIVDSNEYQNLKQEEYGKIRLDGIHTVTTPVIWASFITGKMPKEHGILSGRCWNSTLLEPLKRIIFRLSHGKGWCLIRFIEHWIIPQHIQRMYTIKDHCVPTIFDEDRSVAISIPSYNYWRWPREMSLRGSIGNEAKSKQVSEFIFKEFQKKREFLFKRLKDDWQVVMIHFHILDIYSHLYFNYPQKILQIYTILDDLIKMVKVELEKLVKDEIIVFIISDHGTVSGIHTSYGFFSVNVSLGIRDPHITDFYPLIIKAINTHNIQSLKDKTIKQPPGKKVFLREKDREHKKIDAEEIKERLKELGYL